MCVHTRSNGSNKTGRYPFCRLHIHTYTYRIRRRVERSQEQENLVRLKRNIQMLNIIQYFVLLSVFLKCNKIQFHYAQRSINTPLRVLMYYVRSYEGGCGEHL